MFFLGRMLNHTALPAGSTPTLPAGSTPTLPAGSTPTLPAGSTPALPAGSTPALPGRLSGIQWKCDECRFCTAFWPGSCWVSVKKTP